MRASQINGCANCIDMHWKDLRAVGENEQRLYGLDAWRESPYDTARKHAALPWTEAVGCSPTATWTTKCTKKFLHTSAKKSWQI